MQALQESLSLWSVGLIQLIVIVGIVGSIELVLECLTRLARDNPLLQFLFRALQIGFALFLAMLLLRLVDQLLTVLNSAI